MSKRPIESIKLNEHLTLSLCHPDSECRTESWWLYDKRAGMNLAMRAATKEEALVKAIDCWAGYFARLEKMHNQLQAAVDQLSDAVRPEEDEEDS